jgi:hypothetical protein
MLQNCPKLQALSISKVCWSRQWIVIDFCWLFICIILSIFTNPIFLLTVDKSNSYERQRWLEIPISCS